MARMVAFACQHSLGPSDSDVSISEASYESSDGEGGCRSSTEDDAGLTPYSEDEVEDCGDASSDSSYSDCEDSGDDLLTVVGVTRQLAYLQNDRRDKGLHFISDFLLEEHKNKYYYKGQRQKPSEKAVNSKQEKLQDVTSVKSEDPLEGCSSSMTSGQSNQQICEQTIELQAR
jgi:hypothetical protein